MTQTAQPARPTLLGDVALRSRVADGAEWGGDFALVVPLPGGRLGLGVGDVAGHGGEVAGLMRWLRAAMVEEASTGAVPAVVLDRLNERLTRRAPDAMATAAYAVLDPAAGTVLCASAGHLPLLVVTPGGVRPLPAPVGPPLGVSPVRYESQLAGLPTGATVLGYSDGLVERRGEDIDAGLLRLGRAAQRAAGLAPEPLVDTLFTGLAGESSDDVTVVAVRLPVARFSVVPAPRSAHRPPSGVLTRDAIALRQIERRQIELRRRHLRASGGLPMAPIGCNGAPGEHVAWVRSGTRGRRRGPCRGR